MQQHAQGHSYYSDRIASSQHASHDRLDVLRMGNDYQAHNVERLHYDGRFLADSRGRPAIGLDFSSRGSENSQPRAQSSRSPGRKSPETMLSA
jgi:hypothetical protein